MYKSSTYHSNKNCKKKNGKLFDDLDWIKTQSNQLPQLLAQIILPPWCETLRVHCYASDCLAEVKDGYLMSWFCHWRVINLFHYGCSNRFTKRPSWSNTRYYLQCFETLNLPDLIFKYLTLFFTVDSHWRVLFCFLSNNHINPWFFPKEH